MKEWIVCFQFKIPFCSQTAVPPHVDFQTVEVKAEDIIVALYRASKLLNELTEFDPLDSHFVTVLEKGK